MSKSIRLLVISVSAIFGCILLSFIMSRLYSYRSDHAHIDAYTKGNLRWGQSLDFEHLGPDEEIVITMLMIPDIGEDRGSEYHLKGTPADNFLTLLGRINWNNDEEFTFKPSDRKPLITTLSSQDLMGLSLFRRCERLMPNGLYGTAHDTFKYEYFLHGQKIGEERYLSSISVSDLIRNSNYDEDNLRREHDTPISEDEAQKVITPWMIECRLLQSESQL